MYSQEPPKIVQMVNLIFQKISNPIFFPATPSNFCEAMISNLSRGVSAMILANALFLWSCPTSQEHLFAIDLKGRGNKIAVYNSFVSF